MKKKKFFVDFIIYVLLITVLLITHNSALAPMADRLIRFKSGKVIEMTTNANPTPIAEIEW